MMHITRARVGMLVVFLAGAATQSATGQESEEVISINRGSFVFEELDGDLDIAGNRGFRFHAAANLTGGFFEAWSQCQLPECQPGTIVNLNAGWGGNDLQGVARLRGVRYPDVGGLNSSESAQARFSGSVTMPPMGPAGTTVSVPFAFDGIFAYATPDPFEQHVAALRGGGTVTLTLRPDPEGTSWQIVHADFQFENVKN